VEPLVLNVFSQEDVKGTTALDLKPLYGDECRVGTRRRGDGLVMHDALFCSLVLGRLVRGSHC